LAVSQVNGYVPISTHRYGKMNGFTDDQIIELRKGASWDSKTNVLAQTAQRIAKRPNRTDS
jgi:hypothetical protein